MGSANRSAETATNWEFIAMLLAWQHRAERTLKDACDATLLHFWVLLVLVTRSDMSVRQAADVLELKYTTVAEAAATLERQGAIEKTRSDDDRRLALLSITEEGAQLFRAGDAALVSLAVTAWGDLDVEERKRALYPFYVMGKGLDKSREFDGGVRGDTAFFIACAQMESDFQRICDEAALSPAQALLLMLLVERGPMQPKSISSLLAKPPSGVSKLLRSACDSNLVRFEEGPSRRETTVSLTDKGKNAGRVIEALAAQMLESRFGDDAQAMESLRRTARRLMDKLRANA